MQRTRRQIPTGVQGFDILLGGGMPESQSLILTGEPGSGKTVLAGQIAFSHAARGAPVLLATVTSESQEKLIQDLAGFAFFKPEALGEDLFFVSIYSALKKGPPEARELLLSTLRERKTKLLIVDGLRAIRDLWRDEAKVREFLYELGVGLAALGCASVLTTEYPLQRLMEFPEATTVDGIVSLGREERGPASHRRIEVVKVRGQKHVTGRHSMRIDERGVTVVPRAETTPRVDRSYQPPVRRADFGLPEFDVLMGGGLPEESATLLAGSGGVGKTLLALHFAAAGAARGETALFYAFDEPPGSVVARAGRVGLDVRPMLEARTLRFEYPPPVEADGDELAQDILDKVRACGCKRLVVDGVSELEEAVSTPDRLRPFSAALVFRLRAAGVTTLFTKQISKLVGPELDFSDTPLAAFAENLLFLRHVELSSKLSRLLSILNVRDSAFDSSLREFVIAEDGLKVLAPLPSAEGLLTGAARTIATRPQTGAER